MFTDVPAIVKVKIPPLPSTDPIVSVASLAVVAPPSCVPANTRVSAPEYPEPIVVTTAEYAVPVLVTVKFAVTPPALAVVYVGET